MKKRNCVNCSEFEKHGNFGLCRRFGWEVALGLAERERVCEGIRVEKEENP